MILTVIGLILFAGIVISYRAGENKKKGENRRNEPIIGSFACL